MTNESRTEWQKQAQCLPTDYFLPDGTKPTVAQYLEQKERLGPNCESCPVLKQCYDYALLHEEYGFWANTTEKERRVIRSQTEILPLLALANLDVLEPHVLLPAEELSELENLQSHRSQERESYLPPTEDQYALLAQEFEVQIDF